MWHLGMTVTNQNCIPKENKSTINLGNAQFRTFCFLVCHPNKIKINKIVILPVVLYGCEI
jgi:hypothetical protein